MLSWYWPRDKISLIASGHTASGFDVLEKIATGADLCNAARTMMMALGCIQSQSCNTNTCPTGIATQDKARGKALDVIARHKRVANFQAATLESFFDMVGAMGLDDPDKLTVHHIWKRGSAGIRFHADTLYPQLSHKELLNENINHSEYATHWALASAKSFRPLDGTQ